MKIIIIGQEEPVYFGPYLKGIIEARAQDIALVVIAGKRGSGSHPKTFLESLVYLYSHWLLLEPAAFFKNFFLRLIPTKNRSLKAAAQKHNIPHHFIEDVNDPAFLKLLQDHAPDIIINQSELYLKKKLLTIPKLGVLNRHASLLPHFRGRVGSFWGHAKKNPEYGVTIHWVDEVIDAGPIILQKKFNLDPTLSYAQVLATLFQASIALTLEALDLVAQPHFTPLPNHAEGTLAYKFPTLRQIRDYRKTLTSRRKMEREKSQPGMC